MSTLSELMSVMDKVCQTETAKDFFRSFSQEEISILTAALEYDYVRAIPEEDIKSYLDSDNQPIPGENISEQREAISQRIDETAKMAHKLVSASMTPNIVGSVLPGAFSAICNLADKLNEVAN